MTSLAGTPQVSVVIPTYNREDLLPRALQSVFDQDYDDIEVVVIDNGSTAETAAVLRQFDDPRLRCFRFEKNRGVGAARNKAVLLARGNLIAFIDSDDVWSPGKLGHQVDLFRKYPGVELIFGDYRNMDQPSGNAKSGFDQMRASMELLSVKELEAGVFQVLDGIPEGILLASFFATPTVMLRASVFEKVGNFSASLSGPEDFEFWCRSALRGICFAYTDRTLIERFKDGESLSSKSLLFLPEYLKALDACEVTARHVGRLDLLGRFNQARGRAWRGILRASALAGHRAGAWIAFQNSLRYGFTAGAWLYFLAALAGPGAIAWAKHTRRGP